MCTACVLHVCAHVCVLRGCVHTCVTQGCVCRVRGAGPGSRRSPALSPFQNRSVLGHLWSGSRGRVHSLPGSGHPVPVTAVTGPPPRQLPPHMGLFLAWPVLGAGGTPRSRVAPVEPSSAGGCGCGCGMWAGNARSSRSLPTNIDSGLGARAGMGTLQCPPSPNPTGPGGSGHCVPLSCPGCRGRTSPPEAGVSRGSPCTPPHGLAGVTGLRFLSTPGVQLIPGAGAAGVTLLPPALLPSEG